MKQTLRGWRDLGIRVESTNGGHLKLLLPNGHIVVVSSTPSDHRAIKNMVGDVRRTMRLPAKTAESLMLDKVAVVRDLMKQVA